MSERVESIEGQVAGGAPSRRCAAEPAPEALRDVVSRVPVEVLETMFFAEAVPLACSHAWLAGAAGARIRFDGSHRGETRLSISGAAADSIACGFLGLEPEELSEPLRVQVLLELSNILCGAMLSELWPESKLALSPPELLPAEPYLEGALHQCFELPEGMLAVGIDWREAAPAGS